LELSKHYSVYDLLQPLFDYFNYEESETALPPPKKKPKPPTLLKSQLHHQSSVDTLDSVPTPPPLPQVKDLDPFDGVINAVPEANENHRAMLMSMFLSDQKDLLPPFLLDIPPGLDLNVPIDDQGHSALHWAAALAKLSIVKLLLEKGCNYSATNAHLHTPLMRAVLVANNYENQTFPNLVSLLAVNIPLIDEKRRNVFHHIALISAVKGRSPAAQYYAKVIVDFLHSDPNVAELLILMNAQDVNGDTPLTIAARIGDDILLQLFLANGADKNIENSVGMKPSDFGFDLFQTNSNNQRDVTIPPHLQSTVRFHKGSEVFSGKKNG
jgi:ankyrin repeat protein